MLSGRLFSETSLLGVEHPLPSTTFGTARGKRACVNNPVAQAHSAARSRWSELRVVGSLCEPVIIRILSEA